MHGLQAPFPGTLQYFRDAMAVALFWLTFVACERDAFAVFDPVPDFGYRMVLYGQPIAAVLREKGVVVPLGFEIAPPFRCDAQFRQMFVADAYTFTGLSERTLGKPVFAAERVAPHIA